MTESEAAKLIESGLTTTSPQRWADLGCGSGVFTRALASLLPSGSQIIGVDVNQSSSPEGLLNGVELTFVKSDFTRLDFSNQSFDGFLLANSLHYVVDQADFLEALISRLNLAGRLIIVEYDTNNSNQWVPFPVSYSKLTSMVQSIGQGQISKIGERQSIYQQGLIYSSVITF